MTKTRINTLCASALLLMAISCGKQEGGPAGRVSFSLATEEEVTDVVTRSSVGSFTNMPQAADFTVTVTGQDGQPTPVTDLGGTLSLAAGNYTARATYGSSTDEGFGKPYFLGETAFSVNGGSQTSVTIPVKLGNCLVKMEYSDNFRNYYSDWTFTLRTGQGNSFNFGSDETRAIFIDAYTFTISGTLTNQGGKVQTFAAKEYRNLSAATCYTMRFDASNVGGGSITISFNDSVTDVALGEFDLND